MRAIFRVRAIYCLCLTMSSVLLHAQNYEVKILDAETKTPIEAAAVQLKKNKQLAISDASGIVKFTRIQLPDSIQITALNYRTVNLLFNPQTTIYYLQPFAGESEVIVQTGYQSLPKERATGSFTQIDNQLFNRRISTNVLDRLDGITPGVLFNKNNGEEAFNIRGRSTLEAGASRPLIVLDNFPFEGQINQINPNDVESITLLKDAAAASIWGSRAANGVIVITTRKGRLNQPLQISFTQNLSVGVMSNLFYNRNYLTSSEYIEAERLLFDRGFYNASLSNTTTRPAISPVVELLNQFRRGTITEAFLNTELDNLNQEDLRKQFSQHLYQREANQQYALQLRGGSDKHSYLFSFGYDDNKERQRFNQNSRLTLQAQQSFKLRPRLELTTTLYYVASKQNRPNSFPYRGNALSPASSTQLYPYAQIADAGGNPLPTMKDYRSSYLDSVEALGFQPWRFSVLDEIAQTQHEEQTRTLIARTGLKYRITDAWTAELHYQQEYQQALLLNLKLENSYTARDLVNRFSQRNPTTGAFTYPLPKGGILEQAQSDLNSQNLRGQMQYQQKWSDAHELNGMAGFEIRQRKTTGFSRTVYGYEAAYGIGISNLNYQTSLPVHPFGTAMITATPNNRTETLNRFFSYYANLSYSYHKRYTFTASARSDAANLFGVRANQKRTPLWSLGGLWDISKESFYKLSWLPHLKIRATYGFNGNAVNANSLLTVRFGTSGLTGFPMATLASAPNSELRWEKVGTLNLGVDFSSLSGRLHGSIEWYRKRGLDLLQETVLPPSTGFSSFSGNGASTLTTGWEFLINYAVVRKKNMEWNMQLVLNTLKDQVIDFVRTNSPAQFVRTTGNLIAKPGNPLFSIWSYPWAGIDPSNGDPMGYLAGVPSNNYTSIIAAAQSDSLVFHGSARPTFWGNLRQDFQYKRWGFSLNLIFKGGYYFRSGSVSLNYQDLVLGRQHRDYTARWQTKGDELKSNVPSIIYPSNVARNDFYTYSAVLVERGDHLRFQDIRLSYRLGPWGKKHLTSLELYGYLNNIGILWRANKKGIDPDTNDFVLGIENIPAIRTATFGLKLHL